MRADRSSLGVAGRRRHVMVVHSYYPVGETRVQREAAALLEHEVTVDVICLRGPGEERSEVVDGVAVRRLPIGRNRERGLFLQLVEYLAFMVTAATVLAVRTLRRPYHSVQVHNLPDFLVFSALVPKMTGARIVLDLHDLMPEFLAARLDVPMSHPLVRLVRWQERLACRFAHEVITVTDGWRQRLIGRGVPAGKVSVVMNVAHPALFRTRRRTTGGPDFSVVYHGTFTHRYGVDLLIEAADRLRHEIPGLRLSLLGDGEQRDALMAAVRERNLEGIVEISDRMLGVWELQEYLERADVGVVPNRSSVFTDDLLPTKLLEYVAVGIPVVTARTPMIRSYFDERMVEFFDPGDVDDLAECLLRLANDPRRRRDLTSSAARFLEEHSWDKICQRYAAVVGATPSVREA